MCRRFLRVGGFVLPSSGKELERAARYLPTALTRAGEGTRFLRIQRLHF